MESSRKFCDVCTPEILVFHSAFRPESSTERWLEGATSFKRDCKSETKKHKSDQHKIVEWRVLHLNIIKGLRNICPPRHQNKHFNIEKICTLKNTFIFPNINHCKRKIFTENQNNCGHIPDKQPAYSFVIVRRRKMCGSIVPIKHNKPKEITFWKESELSL